jgi:ribonuclease R
MTETDDADIYLNASALKGVLDGDHVEVLVRGDAATGRARVLRSVRTDLIGTVIGDGSRVQADPGVSVDSFALARRGTPGQVVRFTIKGEQASITEVLGTDTDSHAAMTRFMDRYMLPMERPADVEKAATVPVRLSKSSSRRDLRTQTVITIDDDSSKDLDDALAAEISSDGSIRLWIHIADVAEHVLEGSPLDRAAANVPTSVYLPQGVRHMLPDAFGADRLSLHPGVERDTLCVELRLDKDGDVKGVDLYEARIKSSQRLSYTTVARIMEGRHTDIDPEVLELVRILRTAATRLGLLRVARGGLDAMRVDQQHGSSTGQEDKAHQLIERLMVATNEAVAGWLTDRGMPALWRVHDPIAEDALAEIERVASGFGVVAALGSPISSRALACTAAQIPSGPAGAAFWDALLGALGRARYSVTLGGHFGLGSTGYLHFTSPLRRYPDLMVHRIVKAYLSGQRDASQVAPLLERAAERANDVFRRASMAERDATLALGLAELRVGEQVQATVSGRARSGMRVRLDESGVSGTINAAMTPGTRVTLRVNAVDPIAGRLELGLPDGQRGQNKREKRRPFKR